MNRISNARGRRRWSLSAAFALVLVIVACAITTPQRSTAMGGGARISYYSDAAMTNRVGHERWGCGANTISGEIGPYSHEVDFVCGDPSQTFGEACYKLNCTYGPGDTPCYGQFISIPCPWNDWLGD